MKFSGGGLSSSAESAEWRWAVHMRDIQTLLSLSVRRHTRINSGRDDVVPPRLPDPEQL